MLNFGCVCVLGLLHSSHSKKNKQFQLSIFVGMFRDSMGFVLKIYFSFNGINPSIGFIVSVLQKGHISFVSVNL